MTPARLRALLRDVLVGEYGLSKVGKVWRWTGPDVTWLVELDKSRYSKYFRLDIGIAIRRLSSEWPATQLSSCHIVTHLENFLIGSPVDRPDLMEATHLGTNLDDETRSDRIRTALRSLCEYMQGAGSEKALRERFAAGDFGSALVLKEARVSLEVS